MMMTSWNWDSLSLAMPEVFLALSGLALLVFGAFEKKESIRIMSWAVILMFAVTMFILLDMDWSPQRAFSGHFIMDGFAGYMKLLVLIGLSGSLMLSIRYLVQENMARFEYPVLVLFAGLGMMIMLSANSFLSLYVGLELQSLSLYVLAAIRRDHARSSEAGLKYFVLGALASGMLLFGISLIYGYAGSIGFDAVAATLRDVRADGALPVGVVVGMVFVLVGIAFKISAVPFHMWTPDVYEGAPTSVTALFAIVPKVAAMGLLMRVVYHPFGAMMPDWQQVLWILSTASMGLGAFAALTQNNIKRLMAYSSIGNMGYALIGIVAGTADGAGATILYITIYMMMTAGVFGIIMMMRRDNIAVDHVSDLAGLSKNNPALAYAMAIMMFSMSGIPPLAGFFGKLLVFQAAIVSGFYVLAVFGILTSVVAAYYYLRIIKVMFFDEAADPFDEHPALARKVVIGFCTLFVLVFVLVP
ncbi:MAG TPA: NADH-quinone oxidoreductase subunit NuoN, partial [Micavibrio sp.]